jgi:hypothetical protein
MICLRKVVAGNEGIQLGFTKGRGRSDDASLDVTRWNKSFLESYSSSASK